MDREEIIFWKEKYDGDEGLSVTGVEEELRAKFKANGYATKQDLEKVIKWKFQGRLAGRQKLNLARLKDVDDGRIREITSQAFHAGDDETRLRLLTRIKGIGNALSSVILAFYDPQNYGVLDIHAWRGLFGKEPKDLFASRKRPIQFFNKLREISAMTGLPCRDIEKAIFKKDLNRSRK